MKLGTLIGDPSRIIFRLGPNSEMPPGGRHLEFQYGRQMILLGSPISVPSFIISPQSEIFFDLAAGLQVKYSAIFFVLAAGLL